MDQEKSHPESFKALEAYVRQRLGEQEAAKIGITLNASAQSMTNWRKRGISKLKAFVAQEKYGVDAAALFANGVAKPVSDLDATPTYIPSSAMRKVPVVGTASLGMDGYWTDLEYPVGQGDGHFYFPTKDKNAYVLQVKGGSMHPAIRSGWYVVIEPSRTPQMGEFVLVKLHDGRSTVKEFLWHRDGEYVLQAVSDGERLVLKEDDIEFIHHVGGIMPPSGRQV